MKGYLLLGTTEDDRHYSQTKRYNFPCQGWHAVASVFVERLVKVI